MIINLAKFISFNIYLYFVLDFNKIKIWLYRDSHLL